MHLPCPSQRRLYRPEWPPRPPRAASKELAPVPSSYPCMERHRRARRERRITKQLPFFAICGMNDFNACCNVILGLVHFSREVPHIAAAVCVDKAVWSRSPETQRLLECRPALVAPIHKTASELEQDGFQIGLCNVGGGAGCSACWGSCSSNFCCGKCCALKNITQGTAVCVGANCTSCSSRGIANRHDELDLEGVTERIGIRLNKIVCKSHNGIELWKVGIVNGRGIFIRQLIVRIHAVEVKESGCQIGRSSSSGNRLCGGH
jgi:hypothetical protein